MLRFCFFAAAILSFHLLLAQVQGGDTVRISGIVKPAEAGGTAENFSGTMVNLSGFKEDAGYFSAPVQADGSFNVTLQIYKPTYFEMRYRDYKMDVLLTPAEHDFHVDIKMDSDAVKSMKVTGSHEYDAYRAFKKIDKPFKDKLPALLKDCSSGGNDCNKQLKKEFDDFNAALEYLRQAFKGTFIAEVVAPMSEMPEINDSKPAIMQLRVHFFDNTDFSNEKTYTLPDLNNSVALYTEYMADTTARGRTDFINTLYAKTKNNHNGQKELIGLLLNGFMWSNRENYLVSLAYWAQENAPFMDEQPVLASRLKLLVKTVPGQKAAEVSGTDTGYRDMTLTSVAKANKLTLLIFWASDCVHCRHTLPEFVKFYNDYHPRGLEIFAVSIEPERNQWKKFLAHQKFPWLNVILNQGDPAPNNYFIQSTPTIVLINRDGIILHRFLSVDDFKKVVGEMLDK